MCELQSTKYLHENIFFRIEIIQSWPKLVFGLQRDRLRDLKLGKWLRLWITLLRMHSKNSVRLRCSLVRCISYIRCRCRHYFTVCKTASVDSISELLDYQRCSRESATCFFSCCLRVRIFTKSTEKCTKLRLKLRKEIDVNIKNKCCSTFESACRERKHMKRQNK